MKKNHENRKIVLVSGGLGDIGLAIASLFGRQGFSVAISDLMQESEAQPVLDKIKKEGCEEMIYRQVDVTSETEVEDWLNAVENQWGTPRVIVPNAGIVVLGSLVKDGLPVSEIHRQMDVNFWGSYHVAVIAARHMRARSLSGRIVFMGSWAAERPDARLPAYCISKASVRMLCKTLALELADSGIMVNEVAPGIVAGGLSKKNQEKDTALLKKQLDAIPVHGLVSVEEVAKQVLRLADFEEMNITGSVLPVDGGLSLTSKMSS